MALTRLLPALVLASAATAAQSVPPVGLRANIVELVAVALDDQGTPVVGLQDSDFEIEEDGRLMPISTFAAKNADATGSPADGRVVVLWLDDTVPERAKSIKRIAQLFAEQMSGHDAVAVLLPNQPSDDMTSNKNLVMKRIDAF